ncbi:hypothetical protein NM208_g1254 [Fusarium decemcellulare]|uniref:Uncharacterized protein n=1 Tax=Fusarium decemcellulare TaxID=57161 RepID=A0ACC1SXC3_9HYPO|nr:hypothetical protein NM208_g1254 [Fusarium decemcellulare]
MASETLETESSQEVSGQAAFWIVSTLAVAAIAQPSTSSRRTGRGSVDSNIDLLRCFPGVCLLDALIDLVILGKAVRQEFSVPKPVHHHVCQRVLPKASVLTVKLALSIFAVLPQVIKVLSMSGIPATQFCAFVFFLANMTNLAVELCSLGTDEHYPADWGDLKDVTTLLLVLVLMVQMVFECWIWSNIGRLADYHLPADVDNVCLWFQILCSLAVLTQFIIWVIRYFLYRRLDVSTSPNMTPMHVVIGLTAVLGALRGSPKSDIEPETGIAPPPSWIDHASFTIGLVLCAGLVSNTVAKILDALGRLISREADQSCPNTRSPVAQEGDGEKELGSNHSWTLLKASVRWIWTLGTRIDSLLVPVFDVHSKASVTIALAVFSLITTVCYYLVWFDATGTVNPGWTSILG